MKRLILCLVLVFGFAQFNYLGAQDVQVEQLYLGSITDIPGIVASAQGAVPALGVHIGDPVGTPSYLIKYPPGKKWYMGIIVCNMSSSTISYQLEYDLRYADGASYYVKRISQSIPASCLQTTSIPLPSSVAKRGLFTLTGRVYGTGMGNDNKVTAQVLVY
jgi:hypothetical protein